VLGHVAKSILFGAVLILGTLWAADRLQSGLIARYRERFGFTELADIASLPLVIVLTGVLVFAISPMATGYSRWQEHEADRFGLEITRNGHAAATGSGAPITRCSGTGSTSATTTIPGPTEGRENTNISSSSDCPPGPSAVPKPGLASSVVEVCPVSRCMGVS